MKTFIIAEAGANHNRDFEQAKSLIDVAKESGADVCKFQTYSSETLYSKNTNDFAGYKNINKLIKSIELPREWHKDLKKYCDEVGIEFMSTPFDESAVNELVDLGVKRLKIAGFESTDMRFVDMVCSARLPIIVSLGIGSDFSIIGRIMDMASKWGIDDITFLHCNNAYPTPPHDINLSTVKTLSLNTRYKTGISDHTISPLTPALAVAAGAVVVEKHFTLSKRLTGPDHPFALEPHELKEMVDNVRYTEMCMGNKFGNFTESEKNFKNAMRSIVAKFDIKDGDILTIDNITTKRPYVDGSVPAINFFDVLGHRVNGKVDEDCQLMKSNLKSYFESKKL
jgi:N,N'-diacetyllegionaminate synthase